MLLDKMKGDKNIMQSKSIWQKLSSRKLWIAIIGAAAGIAIAYGADENIVQAISGAAVTLVSIISYIWVEGKIDAAAVDQSADFAKQILNIVDLINEYQEKRQKLIEESAKESSQNE